MNSRTLAIETSGRHGSVVVARGTEILTERELPPPMRHAAELMPAIRDLVHACGWAPGDIEHIYLSLGPGSFTGLRIAVAAVRAMVQALAATGRMCRIVGIPSLDVIAANAPAEFPVVVPILDAKRAQVFAAMYERIGGGAGGALTRVAEASLVDPATFLARTAERAVAMAGPTGKVAILGEGIDYHRPAIQSAGPAIVELDKSLWPGRARSVLALGNAMAARGEFTDPAHLLPIYIRLPEAEEVWRKKQGINL